MPKTDMNTPICDFVTEYLAHSPVRLHMPGHKGCAFFGPEDRDLTEIPGADSLYEASGVIAESEANASALFGCPTFYSTEGSSQCIRAMLFLAMQHAKRHNRPFRILAARNVHKTFLSAVALLDADVQWLYDAVPSYLCACAAPALVEQAIKRYEPSALYLTSPDYLGNMLDLTPIAEICHAHGVLLLVDNAHGAYLRFLTPSQHPIDLGADLCCDSAHKTLAALTGGAYLHLSRSHADLSRDAKDALLLFGSTSPSYLILQSLDRVNPTLMTLPKQLQSFLPQLDALKARLSASRWTLFGNEPQKLTIRPKARGVTGTQLAAHLEDHGIWCEFADPDFTVCMLTPQNDPRDLARLEAALASVPVHEPIPTEPPHARPHECVCSVREAMLAPRRIVPVSDCLNEVLARPDVGCPPAVPILMPGERIDRAAFEALRYYGVEAVSVL